MNWSLSHGNKVFNDCIPQSAVCCADVVWHHNWCSWYCSCCVGTEEPKTFCPNFRRYSCWMLLNAESIQHFPPAVLYTCSSLRWILPISATWLSWTDPGTLNTAIDKSKKWKSRNGHVSSHCKIAPVSLFCLPIVSTTSHHPLLPNSHEAKLIYTHWFFHQKKLLFWQEDRHDKSQGWDESQIINKQWGWNKLVQKQVAKHSMIIWFASILKAPNNQQVELLSFGQWCIWTQ